MPRAALCMTRNAHPKMFHREGLIVIFAARFQDAAGFLLRRAFPCGWFAKMAGLVCRSGPSSLSKQSKTLLKQREMSIAEIFAGKFCRR